MTKAFSSRSKTLSARTMLLAGALALLLVPAMESRASAADTWNYYCGSNVSARSYCLKGSSWGPNQRYGYFTVNAVEGNAGPRKCAIIDVYSNFNHVMVKRFKACGTGQQVAVGVTSQYKNFWAYSMFAYAYNGSDRTQYLLGYAYGYAK